MERKLVNRDGQCEGGVVGGVGGVRGGRWEGWAVRGTCLQEEAGKNCKVADLERVM